MSTLERAIEIAVIAHKGQVQKNGLPYVLHPLRLAETMASIDEKIVATLHDVVEDSVWTIDDLRAEGFSAAVLAAVELLTHDDAESYEDYVARIRDNDLARAVKIADLTDNMNVRRLPEIKPSSLERIEKYHKAWTFLTT